MIKKFALPLALVAAMGVAACSEKAQDESAEAGNAIAADTAATDAAIAGSLRNLYCVTELERDRCCPAARSGSANHQASAFAEDH